ncbi:MAG TPA: YicC/YloC family endoribonuclease [Lentimicrobium sp.]|nr:YicC/YloC family endoribonuclease [Lentimicrobium sp.]
MLKSMTGFGKSTVTLQGKTVTIEIKSLNSKQLDLNVKLAPLFREKEADIRSMISKRLERGKIELTGQIDYTDNELPSVINRALVTGYYNELKEIALSLGEPSTDILSVIMKLPEVMKPSRDVFTDEEWSSVNSCLDKAIDELDKFRIHEGELLLVDFKLHVAIIAKLLTGLDEFEDIRNSNFREKLRASVSEFTANNSLDSNRFEQEIIYYLEKLDITEEKVRLQKHLDYFTETLKESEANGRKLSFVTQEIGREINTIGSKANDANIQRIVVQMKDELEKIKEQLANIL